MRIVNFVVFYINCLTILNARVIVTTIIVTIISKLKKESEKWIYTYLKNCKALD